MGWFALAVLFIICIFVWWNVTNATETPHYTVIEQEGAIEIRDYPSLIVAEAKVTGERQEAIRTGFKLIAAYIFGENIPAEKIAMTTPVLQEKIAMTAPVLQEGQDNSWTVRFVMPAKYTLDSLPKPKDPRVQLKQEGSRRFATIRFSGTPDGSILEEQTALLNNFIKRGNFATLSGPLYAFYNPPWTLPALRRNEVWIEIGQ